MDGVRPAWLTRTRARYVRMRWRLSGAWMWPTFVVLTVVDGVVGHLLPPAGETETLVAATLLALVINVIAVVLLSRPLGMLLRRVRPDIPSVVARDYGGTVVVSAVAAVLLTVGLVHRPVIQARQRAVNDADRARPGIHRRPRARRVPSQPPGRELARDRAGNDLSSLCAQRLRFAELLRDRRPRPAVPDERQVLRL